MTSSQAGFRYRAVSMEFAAYLDAQNVEMQIVTEKGETIVIVCPRDSVFAIQKHIEALAKACPEIATWSNQYRAEPKRSEDAPSGPACSKSSSSPYLALPQE